MGRKDNIQNIINEFVKNEDFSGAILIKEGEEIIYKEAHGYAHRGLKVKNKIDTKFDCASVTKLFTAVAILQLVEKGVISLEDKVLDILEIENSKLNKNIKIFHLLTHSSGMGDDADEEAGEDYSALFKDRPNYSIRELEDTLPLFIHKEQYFEPGEGTRYNNCAFILLGMVVEKLTGEKYRDYVTENVFKRAEMNNTGLFSMDGIVENAAEGYEDIQDEEENIIGWKKNIYSYPPCGAPDGGAGALTTVEDMVKFYEALLNGELLGQEMTDAMVTPKILKVEYTKVKFKYGFVFEYMMDMKDEKVYSFSKDGCNFGVVANTIYIPEYDTKIMILGNQYSNVWGLGEDIICEYYDL
ncbi:serine hydrolase domain-containing protein [Oceanirhabdus sp. W0125-5]|uniref:serine hydrolase domain-containing protein n=1 Tax=Oceanirhabdus sp. W0125-5 TaxID=2999116 RepID=UPI0022F2F3AB|nr:serine hydrolase domain-containing protein [Oceanirhabdus sp. W0125-5]WBW99229.1 serine hydrolase [Oceanirhabdus sp. W0125-5]